jgi:hypothetical protein
VTGEESCDPDDAWTDQGRQLAKEHLMKVERWKLLLLLFVALEGAAPQLLAQGKLFKCVLNEPTTYQQSACPESLPLAEVMTTADVAVKRERPPSSQPDPAVARKAPVPASAASDSPALP